MLAHVQQPKGSKWCGQSCVAMLAGLELEAAAAVVGRGAKGTAQKHLRAALAAHGLELRALARVPKAFAWAGTSAIGVFAAPGPALCRIRWTKAAGRRGHWIVVTAAHVHDPLFPGPMAHDEYRRRLARAHGVLSSWAAVVPLGIDRPGCSPGATGTPSGARRMDPCIQQPDARSL